MRMPATLVSSVTTTDPTVAARIRSAASARVAFAPQVIGGCDIRSRTSVAMSGSFGRRRLGGPVRSHPPPYEQVCKC